MAEQYFSTEGINTYLNPLENDGMMIHCVNMVSDPYGAKSKRTGYSTFLGTVPGTVQSLWQMPLSNGTLQYLYVKSGSIIRSSLQGTGDWTITGNGTVDPAAYIGNAMLDDTMIIGDGVGSTRHTTNGTSFTNTTIAPIAHSFEQYQNRIYAAGTASDLFYSTTNDATNWNTSGTSDSSSFKVPGEGKLGKVFKVSDNLIIPKTSKSMFKWDGYSLIDMATKYGPSNTAQQSIAKAEDYGFFINNFGHYGFGGAKPQLLSNAIQKQFYNKASTGISGTLQKVATVHIYDYLASVGSFTDDFTSRTITNGIIKYDFQKNEYLNFDLADRPTSLFSYQDVNGVQQCIFGDSTGQVYKFDSTTTDNGDPIHAEMVFIYTYKQPEYDKKWNFWRGIFNPGCQAKVQIACSDTYTYQKLRWFDLGDVTDGVAEFRFPTGSRSRFLFVRIYESSDNAKFTYYGCSIDAEVEIKR